MTNSNYVKGYSFENQYVNELRELGYFAGRFHASVGPYWKPDYDRPYKNGYHSCHAPFDVWSVHSSGQYSLYQLKNNTKVTTKEMMDIVTFAMDHPEIDVFLITKIKRKRYEYKVGTNFVF